MGLPAAEEADRIEKLASRFPGASDIQVREALKMEGWHSGRAGQRLAKLSNGTPTRESAVGRLTPDLGLAERLDQALRELRQTKSELADMKKSQAQMNGVRDDSAAWRAKFSVLKAHQLEQQTELESSIQALEQAEGEIADRDATIDTLHAKLKTQSEELQSQRATAADVSGTLESLGGVLSSAVDSGEPVKVKELLKRIREAEGTLQRKAEQKKKPVSKSPMKVELSVRPEGSAEFSKKSNSKLENEIGRLRTEIEQLGEQNEHISEQLSKAHEQLRQAEQNRPYEDDRAKIMKQTAKANEDLQDLKRQIKHALAEKEALQLENDKPSRKLTESRVAFSERSGSEEQSVLKREAEVEALREAKRHSEDMSLHWQAETDKHKQLLTAQEEQLANAKREAVRLNQEVQRLRSLQGDGSTPRSFRGPGTPSSSTTATRSLFEQLSSEIDGITGNDETGKMKVQTSLEQAAEKLKERSVELEAKEERLAEERLHLLELQQTVKQSPARDKKDEKEGREQSPLRERKEKFDEKATEKVELDHARGRSRTMMLQVMLDAEKRRSRVLQQDFASEQDKSAELEEEVQRMQADLSVKRRDIEMLETKLERAPRKKQGWFWSSSGDTSSQETKTEAEEETKKEPERPASGPEQSSEPIEVVQSDRELLAILTKELSLEKARVSKLEAQLRRAAVQQSQPEAAEESTPAENVGSSASPQAQQQEPEEDFFGRIMDMETELLQLHKAFIKSAVLC